jgi:Ser/Thr protein kinase RdoA (MazF antagonist)
MDPQYKSRFNDQILAEALSRYGVSPQAAQELDGFESFIYQFSRSERPHPGDFILRIGHDHRRSENLVRGEVDWINYLARGMGSENGIPVTVARAVESLRGHLVEKLADGQGEHFLATSFVQLKGQPGSRRVMMTDGLTETYGRMLGRIHALSRGYQVSDPAIARPQWDDHVMLDVPDLLPFTEGRVLERYQELMAHLNSLPRDDRSAYGMIHYDAHGGNFLVDEQGRLGLFDFDDCCYSWFINDLAIVLFYVVVNSPDPEALTTAFFPRFLRGYRQENHLDPAWLSEVPFFLKLREIDLYAVIHRSFDVTNLTDRWVADFMRGRKERLEAGQPFVELDFTTFARDLAG